MKFSEIKDSTATELSAKSRDLRQEMFNLRLQQASAQLDERLSGIETALEKLGNEVEAVRKKLPATPPRRAAAARKSS